MLTWETALGIVTGFVIAIGGFLLAGSAVAMVFRWATEFVTPRNPTLDDEDEIDHRFY
jgi:flagellar motor component MotA